jgi:hypothetical protein
MEYSTIKPITLSSNHYEKKYMFLSGGSQLACSPLVPTAVKSTLQHPILSLLEAVINGEEAVINRLARLPHAPYNEIILREQLKEKLIEYSKQELMKVNSVFSKQDLQGIVNQLSEQGLQFLYAQEKHIQSYSKNFPYRDSYYPCHYQNLQKTHFSRQGSLDSLSTASTEASFHKDSFQHKTGHSQLNAKVNSLLKKDNDKHSDLNKKYPDFYRKKFFNSKETILSATYNSKCSEEFLSTRKKILNSSYNCFTEQKLIPLGESTFFHQKQSGPYCQTVSVNNFLGDDLVTPDILHEKLKLSNDHIGKEFTTCRTLELFSMIRIEQNKNLNSLLKNSENTLITSTIKKAIETSQHLLNELNCRTCDLDSGNHQQVKKFLRAAEKADINRLHLTFPTSETCMHAIALRKDPSNPKLWIVLDGNLPTHRLSLEDALRGYSQRGSIRLIARKDLFKADPSIACYQIKWQPEGGAILTEPTTKQLSQWRNLSPEYTEKTRFSNPNRIDNCLFRWKEQNPKAQVRSKSLPPTLPSYRVPMFEEIKKRSTSH